MWGSSEHGAPNIAGSGLVRRLRIWAASLLKRRTVMAPIDLSDPLGGALRDTELLLAFAAQCHRKIRPEKVNALSVAVENVNAARCNGSAVSSHESVAFWVAYDELAIDMAPLSAHSIRASIQLLAPGDPTLKTLPPLFIPFVFGYGIEILFSLLDKVVKAFTQHEQLMHQKS